MARVMLLMGGNMGDVEGRFAAAHELLRDRVGEVVNNSSVVTTAAWGFRGETPDFRNQAVELTTEMSPEELLDATQQIELELGRRRDEEREEKRERGERYASRGVDIDIIFYNDETIESPRLTIPHPLMQEREFVLEPIVEIAPEWHNAREGMSCRELLDRLKQR